MAEGVVIRAAADDRGGMSEALKGGLAGMSETSVPGGRGRSGHKCTRAAWRGRQLQGVQGPGLLHRRRVVLEWRSFTETPRGSNSTETELSVVNLRTERRFLIMSGAMRTLLRRNGPGRVEKPVPTTGRVAPLPTTMEVGKEEEGEVVTIPGLEVM